MKWLIVADGYDSVANMQDKGPARSSFDVNTLRSWLKYLEITDYDVCWARDEKLKTWKGPVLALGDAAQAAALRAGKRIHKLPHPTPHSTTINSREKIDRILEHVKREIAVEDYEKEKKVKVVK